MKSLLAILRLAVVASAAALVACSKSSDEEQIRELIAFTEKSAENRDASDALKFVADDYRDDLGSNKSQLEGLLRGYFLTHPKIELLVNIKEINIETPTSARVRLDLSMLGTKQYGGESSSLTADAQSLRVYLKRIDSKWMVVRAERRAD